MGNIQSGGQSSAKALKDAAITFRDTISITRTHLQLGLSGVGSSNIRVVTWNKLIC